MAFAENLGQFFDTGGFAEEATLEPPDGGSGVTAVDEGSMGGQLKVILETPMQSMQIFDLQVEGGLPLVYCQTSDLIALGAQRTWLLTVLGVTYAIVKREDDGTGVSTLHLRKQ